MLSATSTLTDPARLETIRQVVLADELSGGSFDYMAVLAAEVLHAPTSLVTFVEADRERVEGSIGLPEPWASRGELPLEYSFCKHLIASGEPLLIEDAREHEAVRDNPAVREMRTVSYAGVPLRGPGAQVLGALCVIDHHPRSWVDDEVHILAGLAAAVQREIDHRLALRRQQRRHESAARRFREELEAASRFRTLVEKSLAGIYLLRGERVLYANPRLKELFGYDPDEPVSGIRVSEWVAEEDRERVLENIRLRMEGEVESAQYTFRGVRRDGSPIEVEVHGTRTTLEGEPAIIGTLLDVTRRRRAEEALREAAERLQLVERATEDVIWDWNVRTGEVRWNEAGPRMFRYRPEEVGSTIGWHQEHIHPEDREWVVRDLQAVLSGVQEYWSAEYRFRRGDGRYATVLDRGYVQRNERGDALRVIGTMMDVTERKREEEAQRFLSRASELLDSSLDHESVLASLARLCVPALGDYCLVDLVEEERGIRRVATAHVDPKREARLVREENGRVRPLSEHHPVLRVLRGEESVLLPRCDDVRLRELGYPDGEREALRGPGVCALLVVPLVVGDRRLGALTLGACDSRRHYTPLDLMFVQNLAQRTALAVDHARLYQRATDAVRARDEILGVVSHDLRNPLSAIQMSAAMLGEVGQERRSENQRWLDTIERTVNRMSSLIDDLLDVSSIEAGHFSVQRAEGSVVSLLQEAADLLQPLALEQGVELATRVGGDLTVSMDAHQILRVLSNLVGNAIKFTPRGGRVTLGMERQGDDALFSVADTGPGIPPEQLPHVFDRYWQGRPGDRRGAGLGLAIARGIVEAHGGRIRVESRPGEGATFLFTVPLRDEAEKASGIRSSNGRPSGKMILP